MEEEVFITDIKINHVRNIENFDIPLSESEKKHLIITGKNGSGKTSLLLELRRFLSEISNGNYEKYNKNLDELIKLNYIIEKTNNIHHISKNINTITDLSYSEYNSNLLQIVDFNNEWEKKFKEIIISFDNKNNVFDLYSKGKFILSFFEAKRNITLNTPTGINKVEIKNKYSIEEKAGTDFIQYIVNLKADRSFAKDDNDLDSVKKIDDWFELFEKNLFTLFDTNNVKLEFDRKSYNFNIIEEGKEPYNLTQLSDGYSAILNIVTDLIMRMENNKTKNYDVQGVVLIDEIETHLHIDLQKKILPFLISFFPKIQFIVTTHSPFVINSIENAVICDLEKKIVTTDLSGYSYEAIVENYFDSDKYSSILKSKVENYETLVDKEVLTAEENINLLDLENYFKKLPKFYSDELEVKLQQIKLKKLGKRS